MRVTRNWIFIFTHVGGFRFESHKVKKYNFLFKWKQMDKYFFCKARMILKTPAKKIVWEVFSVLEEISCGPNSKTTAAIESSNNINNSSTSINFKSKQNQKQVSFQISSLSPKLSFVSCSKAPAMFAASSVALFDGWWLLVEKTYCRKGFFLLIRHFVGKKFCFKEC